MSRAAARSLRTLCILGSAMLVAAGCGGGDDAAVPVDTGTPAPDTTAPPGTVAGNPGTETTPQIDPATGQPIDPAAAGGGAAGSSATVPELVGDDVAGGLSPVSSGSLFSPQAVGGEKLLEQSRKESFGAGAGGNSVGTPGPGEAGDPKPAVNYTGAKIYVDGIVHSVNRNGVFPKGDPVFRLLSVSANEIEISLIAGEFTSSGGDGTFLDRGDLVSLVNASEQLTYRVKYLRPITGTSSVGF